jgi:hypothetical protein
MIQLDRSIKFLIFILPLSLITGPLIPEIILIFLIGYLTFVFSKKNIDYVFKNNFFKFRAIIAVFILVRNYFSEFFFESYISSIFYIRFTIFALAIYLLDINFKDIKKILFFSISLCFILLLLDSTFEFFFENRILGNSSIYDSRISSFFGDEYIMGSFVVRLLPIILFCLFWLNLKKIYLYINFFLIFFIVSILVILSGERTALLLFLFICFFLIFLKKFRIIFLINILVFSSIFLFFIKDYNIKERYFDFLTKDNFKKKEFIFFTQEHHSLMLTSLKIIKSNIIFGKGGQSFRYLCKKDKFKTITYENNEVGKEDIGCSTHPHNVFLQIFVEYGLIGLLLYFITLKHIIFSIYKNVVGYNLDVLKINNNIFLSRIFLYLALLVNLLPFIPSGSIFNNWFSIILYLPIGFIMSLREK